MSAKGSGRVGRDAGQSSVEWVGLLVVVMALLLAVTAGVRSWPPGVRLAESVAMRVLCAVGMSSTCAESGDLVAAYGPELAAQVERNAPQIVYEDGMGALPVDFRSCRNQFCGSGQESGPIWESRTGESAAAFVHVVDCRTELARTQSATHGYDCRGERSGHLYIQYWTYYDNSSSVPLLQPVTDGVMHEHAYHADDWEGYQVRVGPEGVEARATSHHGYNYRGGPGSWLSDAGIVHRSAWGPSTGRLYVSGGSHAGHVDDGRRLSIRRLGKAGAAAGVDAYATVQGERKPPARLPRHLSLKPGKTRWTPSSHLALVPIETLDADARATRFAITPPWEKDVYSDPESEDT